MCSPTDFLLLRPIPGQTIMAALQGTGKRALVTGGGGYIGDKLCTALCERGYVVTAFDVHYLSEGGHSSFKKIKGDIRNQDCLLSALREAQADMVFHVASYGMSGRDMLKRKMIEEVNIQGTKNVIEACVETGATRLIYTSTYNVVFGGQEIRNGDSSLPYLHPDQHVDHYSRTKCIAEQEVRRANGQQMKGGEVLKTCALRCAGIYGEGEQRHLPRIVSYIEAGLFRFTYGSADSLVEFLHVDNFCQAHIKAAEAMANGDSPVVGSAYFISDGNPINNFVFFKPLVEGLGYPYPSFRIPLSLVYYIAFLIELLHHIIGGYVYNFQPLLTRAEVFKTGVTHYFSMKEATADFGYRPEPRDLGGVVQWFRRKGHCKKKLSSKNHVCCRSLWNALLRILLAIVLFMLFMNFLPLAS